MSNEKVPGLYPGIIKRTKEIDNLDEVDLYFKIMNLSEYLYKTKKEIESKKIPELDLTEYEYALQFLIYQTTRFGVEFNDPSEKEMLEISPSYEAWFNFYYTHFGSVFTEEQWISFQKLKNGGYDVSEFMPSGSWKDSIKSKNLTRQ